MRPRASISARKDIDLIFKDGRRVTGRYVTLIFRTRPDSNSRISVFVPKRLGGSVRRNRMKRVLKEYVRTNPHAALEGKEVIILCRLPVNRETMVKVREEIGRLFEKLPGNGKR